MTAVEVRALAVAGGCCATATIDWVDRTPERYDLILTIVAFVAAGAVLVAQFAPLSDRVTSYAYFLAAWVLQADAFQSLIGQEQKTPSIVRTVLFTLSLAALALSGMVDYDDRARQRSRVR